MRWFGIVGIFFCFFSTPLSALFLDAEGYYVFSGEFAKYRTFNDIEGSDYDQLRHRFTLNLDFKVTEKISIFSDVKVFPYPGQDYLGGEGTLSSPAANRSPFDHGFKPSPFYLERIWVRYLTDYGIWMMGRAPKHFGLGLLFNEGRGLFDDVHDTTDRISYINQLGSIEFNLGYEKLQELGTCPGCTVKSGGGSRADDMYGFYFGLKYYPDHRDFRFFWQKTIRGNDKTYIDYYMINLNLLFADFNIKSEMDFLIGRTRDLHVVNYWGGKEGVRNSVSGILFLLQGDYTFLPHHNVAMDVGYASGDEDLFRNARDRKNEDASALSFHPNIKPALLMYNTPAEYANSTSSLYNQGVINTYYVKTSYRYETLSFGSITPSIIWGSLVETNPNKDGLGASKNLGLEIDVIYRKMFVRNVGFSLGGGFMFAGDAFKGKDIKKEHGYIIESSVQFLF